MDYFSSNKAIDNEVSDKINLYVNRISTKTLFKRDEGGVEEQVNISNSISTNNIVPNAFHLPPNFSFLPFRGDGINNNFNAILQDLLLTRTKSVLVISSEQAIPYQVMADGLLGNYMVAENCTFTYLNPPNNTLNGRFRADPGWQWAWLVDNQSPSYHRWFKMTVSGDIEFQNGNDEPQTCAFRVAYDNDPPTGGDLFPYEHLINIDKHTVFNQTSSIKNIHLEHVFKFPKLGQPTPRSMKYRLARRSMPGTTPSSIQYRIISLIVTVEQLPYLP